MIRPSSIPEAIVETETVRIVREAAQMSMAVGYPTRLIGRPGTGKSSALWHVAKEMGGSYCEITGAGKNIKSVFELLLSSINKRCGKNHLSAIADAVYYEFEPQQTWCSEMNDFRFMPRLVFIDEIQTIEATAFRELLRVQERCSLALVLAGNEERLAADNKDAATWAQIESRIMPPQHLPGPSRKDCELIGSTYNVEGTNAYALLAAYGVATNFRALVQLLEVSKRLTGDATGIRCDHIEAAIRLMKPRAEILKLIKSEAA